MSSTPAEVREEKSTSLSTVLSLYLPAAMLALGQSIAAPALPVYAKSFDVSFEVAALIVIVVPWGGVVSAFPTGYMIDRFGRKPVLIMGPLITALMAFGTAFAPSFEFLIVTRFISGYAAQMWQQSRLAMIADMGGDRERGKMITWMMTTQRFGTLFAPAIGGTVALIDIRLPFIIHGVFVLVALVPSFKLIKETAPPESRRGAAEGDWGYVWTQLMRPQMLYFIAAQVFANLTRGNIQGVLNLYMAYAYNTGTQTLGLIATGNGIMTLPIGFSTGIIMDRYGRKMTIVPGFLGLFVASVYCVWTVLAGASFNAFLVGYYLLHIAQAVTFGNMQVLGSDLAPARARGRFIGIWRFMAELGNATSPVMFSLLALIGYAASFSFVAACALATASIVAFKVKETVGAQRARTVEAEVKPPDGEAAPATTEPAVAESKAVVP